MNLPKNIICCAIAYGKQNILDPSDLPLQRQHYLYKNIRQFVDEPCKDIVCPRPQILPADNSDTKEVCMEAVENGEPVAQRGQ